MGLESCSLMLGKGLLSTADGMVTRWEGCALESCVPVASELTEGWKELLSRHCSTGAGKVDGDGGDAGTS